MIDYRAGVWGFHVSWGWYGSLAPRALTMAVPNAVITFVVASWLQPPSSNDFTGDGFNADGSSSVYETDATAKAAQSVIGAFTLVMIFILYNRSRTSYNRWWEGGTLLQKTRGEWFNAYSSIMAFTSTDPNLQDQVHSYTHLLARLFSLLMCCGLQQVSPNRDRPFEVIDLAGIEQESIDFLNSAPDKIEVILQWVQRSMVLQAQTGVLPVAPPILSRAFQEVSRGIVNLQNARKIADFPYPFPLAQISMILQLLHWFMTPFISALALPRGWAVVFAFLSIFVLWCIHFNALDLEFPFGSRENDLPMVEFQQDWNNSIITLQNKMATRPPFFQFEQEFHEDLEIVMSDATALFIARVPPSLDKGTARIKVSALRGKAHRRQSVRSSDARNSLIKRDQEGTENEGRGLKFMLPASLRKTASREIGDNDAAIPPASSSDNRRRRSLAPISKSITAAPVKSEEDDRQSHLSSASHPSSKEERARSKESVDEKSSIKQSLGSGSSHGRHGDALAADSADRVQGQRRPVRLSHEEKVIDRGQQGRDASSGSRDRKDSADGSQGRGRERGDLPPDRSDSEERSQEERGGINSSKDERRSIDRNEERRDAPPGSQDRRYGAGRSGEPSNDDRASTGRPAFVSKAVSQI